MYHDICQSCELAAFVGDMQDPPIYNQSLDFDPEEVAKGESAILTMQRDISAVKIALERLQAQKTRLELLLKKQVGCLSPIHRMPDELLLSLLQMTMHISPYEVLSKDGEARL